jgi:hypothetical protein
MILLRMVLTQNEYFSPNWIWRMLPAVPATTPKF